MSTKDELAQNICASSNTLNELQGTLLNLESWDETAELEPAAAGDITANLGLVGCIPDSGKAVLCGTHGRSPYPVFSSGDECRCATKPSSRHSAGRRGNSCYA